MLKGPFTEATIDFVKVCQQARLTSDEECRICSRVSCYHFNSARAKKIKDFVTDKVVFDQIDFRCAIEFEEEGEVNIFHWLLKSLPGVCSSILERLEQENLNRLFGMHEDCLLENKVVVENRVRILEGLIIDLEEDFGTLTAYLSRIDISRFDAARWAQLSEKSNTMLSVAIEQANKGRPECLRLIIGQTEIGKLNFEDRFFPSYDMVCHNGSALQGIRTKSLLQESYLGVANPIALYWLLLHYPIKSLKINEEIKGKLIFPATEMYDLFVVLDETREICYKIQNEGAIDNGMLDQSITALINKADEVQSYTENADPYFYVWYFLKAIGHQRTEEVKAKIPPYSKQFFDIARLEATSKPPVEKDIPLAGETPRFIHTFRRRLAALSSISPQNSPRAPSVNEYPLVTSTNTSPRSLPPLVVRGERPSMFEGGSPRSPKIPFAKGLRSNRSESPRRERTILAEEEKRDGISAAFAKLKLFGVDKSSPRKDPAIYYTSQLKEMLLAALNTKAEYCIECDNISRKSEHGDTKTGTTISRLKEALKCPHTNWQATLDLHNFLLEGEPIQFIDFNSEITLNGFGQVRLLTLLAISRPFEFSYILENMSNKQFEAIDFERNELFLNNPYSLEGLITELEENYHTLAAYLRRQNPTLLNVQKSLIGYDSTILLTSIELANKRHIKSLEILLKKANQIEMDFSVQFRSGQTYWDATYLGMSNPIAMYMLLNQLPREKLPISADTEKLLAGYPIALYMFRFFNMLNILRENFKQTPPGKYQQPERILSLLLEHACIAGKVCRDTLFDPMFIAGSFLFEIGFFDMAIVAMKKVSERSQHIQEARRLIELHEQQQASIAEKKKQSETSSPKASPRTDSPRSVSSPSFLIRFRSSSVEQYNSRVFASAPSLPSINEELGGEDTKGLDVQRGSGVSSPRTPGSPKTKTPS